MPGILTSTSSSQAGSVSHRSHQNPHHSETFVEAYNHETFGLGDHSFHSESYDSASGDEDENDDSDFDNNSHDFTSDGSDEYRQGTEVEVLARKETANVRYWRMIVLLVIVGTGAIVTTATYLFLVQKERDDASNNFQLFANTIAISSGSHFEELRTAMVSMSESITAAATEANDAFPYVRVPLFEVLGSQNLGLSSVELLAWAPLVTETQLDVWSEFSALNSDWHNESWALVRAAAEEDADGVFDHAEHANEHDGQNERKRLLLEHRGEIVWFNPDRTPDAVPAAVTIDDLKNDTTAVETGERMDSTEPDRHHAEVVTAPVIEPVVVEPVDEHADDHGGDHEDDHEDGHEHNEAVQSTELEYIPDDTLRNFIWDLSRDEPGYTRVQTSGPFAPMWQMSPPPYAASYINYNAMDQETVKDLLPVMIRTGEGVMSEVRPELSIFSTLGSRGDLDDHGHSHSNDQVVSSYDHPHSIYMEPVFEELTESHIVGFVLGLVPWDVYLFGLLPEGVNGIYAVLRNTCGQANTYVVNGRDSTFVGEGDLHDHVYNSTEFVVPITTYRYNDTAAAEGHCVYSFSLYSSNEFSAESKTNLPAIFTLVISLIFIVMALTFCMYDRYVRQRNSLVLNAANRSNEIISSLFPSQVRDRLFADTAAEEERVSSKAVNVRLKSMLNSGEFGTNIETDENDIMYKTKPIADLFPETTILFADIAGFTAWSSVREPTQVFVLLETLYRAFDEIAKKRRVFKVETVGDCYVAVTGLPDPRKDHAVAMARFARDCMFRMRVLSKKLEVTLGPDTGDLAMRMGIHSGPVTAGVLRGERSRFQLFGDTMNTAARMEHNGIRDKIQVSQDTADLLIAAGKTNWLSRREDVIVAKGKGEMQTYWLETSSRGDLSSSMDGTTSSSGGSEGHRDGSTYGENSQGKGGVYDAKAIRLIEWNVDVLLRLLKQIVARRRALPLPSQSEPHESHFTVTQKGNTLDEVKEIICLPDFDAKAAANQEDPESITLDPLIVQQLHGYVCNIAAIYRENPFHNFEHASHVTMSVVKLLSRIVAPNEGLLEENTGHRHGKQFVASSLHDHTYGITSDPLTQFSCVLSALIHDVDHSGVPNAQLVKENTEVALQYKNKSVAEQNSVDLAWNLLMDEDYTELRHAIYETDTELKRFRQLVVNSVMATDIVDKELKTLRNLRWDRAFSESNQAMNTRDTVNRKATIVIEHLIQASDVAHTMQHWHIYRKWNERFFIECYQAFKDGRADKDPSEGWYQGELGFFDFYIIPLANKLKDCGVFGVSSDEYLNYAKRNRAEWEARGREVVDEMIELVNNKIPAAPPPTAGNSIRPLKESHSARLA